MADIGLEGTYMPMVCEAGTLMDLRKLAGPPPALGKKWFMINLATGEVKWYTSARRKTNYRKGRR